MVYLALCLAVVGPLAVALWFRSRFDGLDTAPTPDVVAYDDTELRAAFQAALDELEARLEEMEGTVREQTLAISAGIEHVDRAERRIRSAVGRARKRMEDLGYADEGIEAEAEELRQIDAFERGGEGLPAVHGNVAQPQQVDMSAFPGDWRPFVGE